MPVSASDNPNFAYFGIAVGIINIMIPIDEHDILTSVDLSFNMDGLPISKSSKICFWPILVSIDNYSTLKNHPFVAAIYCGQEKPKLDLYLSKFTLELKQLMEEGLLIKNVDVKVNVRAFICDTPARTMLKQTKGHGGYFCCERCTTRGEYHEFNKTTSYPEINANKRTHTAFMMQTDSDHHVGKSPLEQLSIDFIKDFVLDYMHAILLGSMKRLLNLWFTKIPYKVSSQTKTSVSKDLLVFRQLTPREFRRRPRSLDELERWKAVEMRTFLLYVGALAIKGQVKDDYFKHFLLLFYAIRILCSPKLSALDSFIDYAEKLLHKFIGMYPKIYKRSAVVYNIHLLQHIPDDVRRYGQLDGISAFKYENKLKSIKDKIRSGNLPLTQISNRLAEAAQHVPVSGCNRDSTGEKATKAISQKLNVSNCVIDPQVEKDSYLILKDGQFGFLIKVNENFLEVGIYTDFESAFDYPCQSSLIEFWKIDKSKWKKMKVHKSDCVAKCFSLVKKNDFYLISMI